VKRLCVLLLVGLCLPVWAVSADNHTVPKGATIYIEKMQDDLDGFIRAEFVKKHIPLAIVMSPEQAELIMTGDASTETKHTWHEGWLTPERDHIVGSVTIVDRKTGRFVWASEAGDRSVWWGPLKRGGARKVADRIAHNLKRAIR
jgi:hypothetical protein